MRLKSIFVISVVIFLLSNCKPKSVENNLKVPTQGYSPETLSFIHDTFRVEPFLQEQADLIMEGQEEVQTFDDLIDRDTANKRKKSSSVKIVILRDDINDLEMRNMLRCIASLKNDTLDINISMNNGFSGEGVSILYTKNKLTTRIYQFTDIDDPTKKEPTFTVEKQKLALNKSNYQVGDSIYGHIYARISGDNAKYYAEGFFRAKITSRK